ncbi:hypothetical protein AAG906_032525 [Vitis piasezkii]
MGKSWADDMILSYNDVVLRRSDLDILSGPHFLNDRLIEFYFSYLTSCYPSPDISLVPPSIAFWIMNCPDTGSLRDFIEPLKLSEKKLVIFPINNNDDVEQAEGGTHWSLLAFEENANVFVHHDSCGGLNEAHARKLYKAVVGFMGNSNSSRAQYLECKDSPQQANCYDCGLYVAATAKAICCWYGSGQPGEGLWFSVVKEQVTSSAVTDLRSEMLGLIRNLQ